MLQQIPDRIKGIFFVLISAFMYASLPILAKITFASGLEPVQSLLLRYLFAVGMLMPYLFIIRHEHLSLDSPLVLLQGLFLVSGSLLYFAGLKYLSAGLLTIIFFTYPILVTILDIIILKNRPDAKLILGVILAVTGVTLIFSQTGSHQVISLKGISLGMLSSLCYAVYSLIGQRTTSGNSTLSLTLVFCLLGGFSLLLLTAGHWQFMLHLTGFQLLMILAMALFNTILSVSFFLKGVAKIGASWASLVSIAEPVITLIMAFLILGETMLPRELTGAAMVVVSLLLAIAPRKRQGGIPAK